MDARELVASGLDNPDFVERIGDDDDLLEAGVNSGEMIRIALRCEEVLGRPLSDDEMAALNSVRDVAALLGGTGAGGPDAALGDGRG